MAYVEFDSQEVAVKALEACNGMSLAGRNIRLDYAKPRAPRDDGGGNGRGGGDSFSFSSGFGGFGADSGGFTASKFASGNTSTNPNLTPVTPKGPRDVPKADSSSTFALELTGKFLDSLSPI